MEEAAKRRAPGLALPFLPLPRPAGWASPVATALDPAPQNRSAPQSLGTSVCLKLTGRKQRMFQMENDPFLSSLPQAESDRSI